MPPVYLNPSIVIVEVDDMGIGTDERVRVAEALTRQIREHIAPAWGVTATARSMTLLTPPRPLEWHMRLLKVPTMAGALGFHDETPDGSPILYVFPELCKQNGTTWTSCASHEIAEALVDPLLGDIRQAADGKLWACEVADAVEASVYDIDGVEVSNFCYPAWFNPPSNKTGVKYDHLGQCKTDHEILAGGYGQTYDPAKGWSQVGAMRPHRQALYDLGLGRAARRAA